MERKSGIPAIFVAAAAILVGSCGEPMGPAPEILDTGPSFVESCIPSQPQCQLYYVPYDESIAQGMMAHGDPRCQDAGAALDQTAMNGGILYWDEKIEVDGGTLYGDYHHGDQEIHVWAGVFQEGAAMTNAQVLAHEAAHAAGYREADAVWVHNNCV